MLLTNNEGREEERVQRGVMFEPLVRVLYRDDVSVFNECLHDQTHNHKVSFHVFQMHFLGLMAG